MSWCIHGMGMLLFNPTLTSELLGACRNLRIWVIPILFKEASIAIAQYTMRKGYSWPKTMYWPWLEVKVTSSVWKMSMSCIKLHSLIYTLSIPFSFPIPLMNVTCIDFHWKRICMLIKPGGIRKKSDACISSGTSSGIFSVVKLPGSW